MVSDQWPGMLVGGERAGEGEGSVRAEEVLAAGAERRARREVSVEVEGFGGSILEQASAEEKSAG